MMNLDGARAGEGVVKQPGILSPKKGEDYGVTTTPKEESKNSPGVTEPVFSSEERDLNIEIPTGWHVKR